MGSLDRRIFCGVGLLSALLFLIGGILIITSGDPVSSATNSNALYLTAAAGVLAIVYGVGGLLGKPEQVKLIRDVVIAVAGLAFIASAFVGSSAETVLSVAGIMAAIVLLLDALAKWTDKILGAMYIGLALALVMFAVSVLSLVSGGSLYGGLVPVVFGLGIALMLVISMMIPDVKAKPVEQKPAEKKAPKEKEVPKSKPVPKVDKPAPAPVAEPVKEEKKPEAPAKEPVKDAAEAKPVEEPKKEASSKVDNDFMKKLVSSRKAQKMETTVEAKKEVAEVQEPEETMEDVPETVVEPVDDVPEEKEAEAVPEPQPDEATEESEPETEGSQEPVSEETEAVQVTDDLSEPVMEMDGGTVVGSEGTEDVEDVPEEIVEDVPEPVMESSADTPETAVEPVDDVPDENEATAVPETQPEPVPEETEPETEGSQEPVPEETEAVQEPVQENPAEVVEETTVGSADITGEAVAEESLVESHEGDEFTDYSPEAVVRRAAWNKGLRCRREYGDHCIPVAFVKGKVAVFVQPSDADTSIDDVLRSEGWTVLRYDEAAVTDGLAQGEEIAVAVKTNMREAKAAAKKKKKSSKK